MMNAQQLKEHLYENTNLIEEVLEKLGIHHITSASGERIMGALPDGDNASSVQVLLDTPYLTTVVHTRSDYNGHDIYGLVEYLKKERFPKSYYWVAKELSIETNGIYKDTRKDFVKILDCLVGNYEEREVEDVKHLEETVFEEFIISPHRLFSEEGISIKSQEKFKVGYDIEGSRIIFPIYDECGNLITIKGRTVLEDCENKYLAYFNFKGKNILYGLYENYFDIIQANELIVVEAEKSVMKADTMDINNIVALSKKKISKEQFDKLVSMGKDIVFALDKDVDIEKLRIMSEQFKGMARVWAVYDKDNLLDKKDSPFDKGKQVWYDIYKHKERLI